MEPKEKIGLLQKALNKLIEEERGSLVSISSNHQEDPIPVDDGGGENTQVLLSKLLSQMDSLKEDVDEPQPPLKNEMSAPADEVAGGSYEAISNEEIMKEFREIKKQNLKTHWLLSMMIGLTLAWRLSEVSIALKLKQGLSHPFKSFGNMLKCIFKSRHSLNEKELERDAANKKEQVPQIYSFPGLKAPEIPNAVFTNKDQ